MTAPKTTLLFLLSALLAGCCANNRCECADERADALYLKFQVGADGAPASTTLFEPNEVDTVYVLRYALPQVPNTKVPHDSVALIRGPLQTNNVIIINNNAPFAAVSGRRLNSFSYLVFVKLTNRQRKEFKVQDIALKGSLEGDGCCTCYRNSYKKAAVDSIPYTVTETDQQPVEIPLFKN